MSQCSSTASAVNGASPTWPRTNANRCALPSPRRPRGIGTSKFQQSEVDERVGQRRAGGRFGAAEERGPRRADVQPAVQSRKSHLEHVALLLVARQPYGESARASCSR